MHAYGNYEHVKVIPWLNWLGTEVRVGWSHVNAALHLLLTMKTALLEWDPEMSWYDEFSAIPD